MSPFAFVLAWVVHTTVLGLAVLALPALFRLRHTRALVAWWQHAAMFVVLMPLVPLWLPSQPAVPGPMMTFLDSTTVAIAPRLADAPGLSPLTWLAAIWGLGVALRLAWLVVGRGVAARPRRRCDLFGARRSGSGRSSR